jgi:hypothetical protein
MQQTCNLAGGRPLRGLEIRFGAAQGVFGKILLPLLRFHTPSVATGPWIFVPKWAQGYERREPSLPPSIIERILAAMLSIANGFVSTAMPGARCPFPRTAFSA